MDERVFAGEYRVMRELGSDAVGRTLLAVGPDGGQYVVRVIRPLDAAAVDEVERIVAAMSGVRHPALATIHEWGHEAGEFFVVRDYVAGVDLKTELELQDRFAPFSVARYGADIADALEQIHQRGIAHGNVSTGNILRLPTDEVRLVGGGTAAPWVIADAATAPPWTANYLAPERVEGAAPSPATDVYALGVVLYELVTGRLPFAGETAGEVADRQLHEVPVPVGELVPEAPASLERIIMRALEKVPEERWASAREMAAELARVETDESPVPLAVAPAPAKKGRGPIWAVVVLLVLAALGTAWALGVFPGGGVTVPDVVGRTLVEAREAITAAGLVPGGVTYSGVSASGIADGLVAQQAPSAGTTAERGDVVDLVLAGRELLTVPEVEGLTEPQAREAIDAAGLVVGAVTRVSTTTVEAGVVTSQAPAQGEQVAKGSRIDLWIAEAPVSLQVPDVTGMQQVDASSALIDAGFAVKSVARASTTVASGRVIDQVPAAGATAQTGSTVTIRVSAGPGQVTVPNVEGMTQSQAVNALSAAGFLTQVKQQTGGGTVGTVVDQSPTGGVKADPGSTVIVTVVQ